MCSSSDSRRAVEDMSKSDSNEADMVVWVSSLSWVRLMRLMREEKGGGEGGGDKRKIH